MCVCVCICGKYEKDSVLVGTAYLTGRRWPSDSSSAWLYGTSRGRPCPIFEAMNTKHANGRHNDVTPVRKRAGWVYLPWLFCRRSWWSSSKSPRRWCCPGSRRTCRSWTAAQRTSCRCRSRRSTRFWTESRNCPRPASRPLPGSGTPTTTTTGRTRPNRAF